VGTISISKPSRTARFWASIFIPSMSVIFRLTVLMASVWSMLRMWMLKSMSLSVFSSSARIRSSISGAVICKKEAAQNLVPIWNCRAEAKRKAEGAIKSLTCRPEGASQSQSKANRSPSGCRMPCSSSSHSRPSSTFARAPMTLKWFNASRVIRENLALAARISDSVMVRTSSLVFTMPLLPFSSCRRSIWV